MHLQIRSNRWSRAFMRALLSFLLFGMPVGAHALGFGALQLSSHLNQELYGNVPLLLNASDDIASVQVQLASRQEYRQIGLPWQSDLERVTVVLEGKHSDAPHIVLRSLGTIQSPLLSVLLKASKVGHGTYYKHFQLLLDPADAPAVHPQPELIPLPARAASPAELAAVEKEPQGWARTWRYGPVQRGDSLSEIAFRLRRDKRFNNRQVMLSLYEKNPQAFVDGDINQLKRGTWLDVPEGDVVKTYASAPAMKRLSALLHAPVSAAGSGISQPDAQAAAKSTKRPRAQMPTATKAENTRPEQALRYSGNISIDGASASSAPAPKTPANIAEDKQFKAIHAELMAGKLRMSDLSRSVSDINHAVAGIKEDMASLKKDVATIKTQTQQIRQQPVESVNIWMLTLMALLAGMFGAFVVVAMRKNRTPVSASTIETASEPVSQPEQADDGAKLASKPTPKSTSKPTSKPVADEVVQLLNSAETKLGACDFELAESELERIDGLNPDSVRAAALKAQLYHETERFHERDALINSMSESADKKRWEKFCSLLPSHVWNACFGGNIDMSSQQGGNA